MIEQSITLASTGAARVSGRDNRLMLGYSPNRKIYRVNITPSGEWEGMTIRALWHTEQGRVISSLVEDGSVDVPAAITAVPGSGQLNFEGSDGTRTLSSGDIQYSFAANSGTEDGTMPQPGTSAWEAFIAAVQEQAGGVTPNEKKLILSVLMAVADNAKAEEAYNALADLWGGAHLDTTTALLGRAVLGKMILGRN